MIKNVSNISSKTKNILPKSSPSLIDYSRVGLTSYLELEFTKYGIANEIPTAIAVINCESGFQVNPKHNNISWGIAQFTPATWHDYGYGDIMNPVSQINVMAKMWSLGLANRWDCFRLGLYH